MWSCMFVERECGPSREIQMIADRADGDDSVDKIAPANLGHRADHRAGAAPHPSVRRLCCARNCRSKEVNQLPNPLAIGVTIGGVLLDVIAPRPKPRAGTDRESSLRFRFPDGRTPPARPSREQEGPPRASGNRS